MPPTASPQFHPARSGRDRRADHDRRRIERRQRVVAVQVERRRGGDRRARADRRAGRDRRRSFAATRPETDTATPETRTETRLSARDRTKARMLPDDFMLAGGDTAARLSRVIRKKWANAPRPVRAGLVEGLTPILDPLKTGGPVSEAVRDACEEVVATWLAAFRRG